MSAATAPGKARPVTHRSFSWGLLGKIATIPAVWLPVLLIEFTNVSNESLLILLAPLFELFLWIAAVAITVALLANLLPKPSAWLVMAITPTLVAMCVYMNNWAIYHPQSYFATHQWGFGEIADILETTDGTRSEDENISLPLYLSDLSTTGTVEVADDVDGTPVYFVPQALRLLGGGGGYVYFPDDLPAAESVEIRYYPVALDDVLELGDGWWYVYTR